MISCLQLYLPISDWLSDDECETADKSSMRAKQGQEYSEECILANTVDWDTSQQTVVRLILKEKFTVNIKIQFRGVNSKAIRPMFQLYIGSELSL